MKRVVGPGILYDGNFISTFYCISMDVITHNFIDKPFACVRTTL